ncbi:MAG: hypothetical protein ABI203_12025 [Mucilaginibacter sp.]
MDDLKNEERVATADSNQLILTNRRVLYKSGQLYKSIRLENITYMELSKKPIPVILYVALIISLLLPLFFNSDQDGLDDAFRFAGGIMLTGIFTYVLIKRRNLLFGTSGGKIEIKAGHMSNDECYRFIEYTEHAINSTKPHDTATVVHD